MLRGGLSWRLSSAMRGEVVLLGLARWCSAWLSANSQPTAFVGVFKTSTGFLHSTFVLWQASLSPSYNWSFEDPLD